MYKTIEPGGNNRVPSCRVGIYRLAYRQGHQVMVRLPRGTLLRAGWTVGHRVDVEYDAQKGRLRLTRKKHGAFKIGGKGKSVPGDDTEGRLRWTAQAGRPIITNGKSFTTLNWTYRSTDDAIIINVQDKMEIAQ